MLSRKPTLSSRLKFPFQGSAGRVQAIDVPIVGGEVNSAASNRRSRRHPALDLKFPSLRARLGIDCIEISVVASHVHQTARQSRRSNHHPTRVKLPFHTIEFPHSG